MRRLCFLESALRSGPRTDLQLPLLLVIGAMGDALPALTNLSGSEDECQDPSKVWVGF